MLLCVPFVAAHPWLEDPIRWRLRHAGELEELPEDVVRAPGEQVQADLRWLTPVEIDLHRQPLGVGGADVEPDTARGRDVETPARAAAKHERVRHRQVGPPAL